MSEFNRTESEATIAEIARAAALANMNDIDAAVRQADNTLREMPEYDQINDILAERGLRVAVHDARHSRCPKCEVCEGLRHHWMTDPQPDTRLPEYRCAHCSTRGRECTGCDGDGCEACAGEGVMEVEVRRTVDERLVEKLP